jgi:enoyl-[acyl-carrier protein] reductase II
VSCAFFKVPLNTFRNVKKETLSLWVNVPMLYPNIEEIMKIIVEEGVKIVLLRQESKTWTPYLKENGITVVHVSAVPIY